jgi:Lrp/AsnC family leucine-responsive transcriptional regulator
MNDYEVISKFNKKYNLVTRKIVRLLSENSRLSVAEISKRLNVSRPTVKDRITRLEKEFGVKYTIEIDERAIGLNSPHIIAIKFKKKPNYEKIKTILTSSYIPQVAFSVSGDYDLVIYANALSGSAYAHWDKAMRILLGEYGATWEPSEVIHRQLGFFPLRNEAINKTNLDETSKALLTFLNNNARLSFQQLSKMLKMHFNTVKYNYDKLVKAGYIKRATITMDLIKSLCFMTFFTNYVPTHGYEQQSAKAREAVFSDDDNPLISRYPISAPLIGSHDLFALSVFDDKAIAYKHDLSFHKSLFVNHGIKMVTGEIKYIILGRLPIRSLDTRKEFKKIVWTSELEE